MEQSLQQRIRALEAQQAALQKELAALYQQAGRDGRPPLADVRIVDLSWAVFGPLSTQILADMGAEVIKVERVDGGDIGRQTHSAYFTNRNKQSLAVDLRALEGREVVLKLAETAHIFVQSFRPGVAERLGVDYATVSRRNPRIVYCSLSGYGQDGPYRTRGSADLIMQGMSGMLSLMGHEDGPPTSVGFLVCDITGALYNAIAMLLGFWVQQQRGLGQHIELALLDCAVAVQSFPITWYLNHPDEPPQRAGSGHWRRLPLYGVFATKDRPLTLMAGLRDMRWPRLTAVPGLEALAHDPRFATHENRLAHAAELDAALQALLRTRTRDEWLALLTEADILCGPVYTYDELFADPQFQYNGMVGELRDQEGFPMKLLHPPIRLSRTPGQVHSPMPSLGQHTETILLGLGYSAGVIQRLRQQGVVADVRWPSGN
jgi:crotonobetainyl-CoA:carnitine CoA-transferase CaiB-like acyl-CoA transferase